MQHGDHRPALPVPLRDPIEQHRDRLRIDSGEWLVEQNNRGILQNEPCEQRPLQLADRELANPPSDSQSGDGPA